jgi:DNA-binding transcriptional ArsR family regulator
MVERLSTRAGERRRLDRVYGAIADPTRRAMLGVLARGEVNVGMLAQRFPISFNGVSKHVKVLEQAGLVRRSVRGREHWLTLRPAPLRDASRWLDHYREFWDNRLEALEGFLLQQQDDSDIKRRRDGGRTGKE